MRTRRAIHLFTLFALSAVTLGLTACSGGGSSTPPTPPPAAISVAFSPTPPTTLIAATTASLTAIVSNDSSNAGVKWTVTCGGTSCGSFAPASTASGTASTYTAPSTPPSPATVTVTATSAADATKSASATITITAAPPGISVAFSAAPPTTLAVNATTSITAVVSNDTANAGVKWTVSCTSCGSFAPTSTASGTATVYTAPAAPPSPAAVTVTATSVTDTTKSATATITIISVLSNGNYVYHFSGEDAAGPYFVAGVFTVLNGAITAGEQDFTDFAAGYTNNLVASGSSLGAAGGTIQIALNTGNTNIGVSGIETLHGTRVSASRVLISEFDTFATGTGSIDLQTGTAAPSGGYAFNLVGLDGSSTPVPMAIGGILDVTGTSLSNTGSVLDYNDGGTVGQGLLVSSGSVTAPDSFGRVTFTVTPNQTLPGFVLNGYIVGPNRIQLVEALNDPLNGTLGGTALGQGTHTGGFTAANSGNTTYVFSGTGADASGSMQLAAGITLATNGSVSGSLSLNDQTNFGTVTLSTGSYTVDATGRVTISNVSPSLVATIPFVFQLYLDGSGNALELGVDNSQLSAGPAYQQTAAPPQLAGNYALSGIGFGSLANKEPAWSAIGPVTVASNAFTGFTDYNLLGKTPVSNVSLTGTVSSTAVPPVALTGLNATSATTSNTYNYFLIDSTRAFIIEVDGAQMGLLALEGVGP
jgi:hypothetical protein